MTKQRIKGRYHEGLIRKKSRKLPCYQHDEMIKMTIATSMTKRENQGCYHEGLIRKKTVEDSPATSMTK